MTTLTSSKTKCEFCDVMMDSDLDVIEHLMSEIHCTNKSEFIRHQRDIGHKMVKSTPLDIEQLLNSLKLKTPQDVQQLAKKNFFKVNRSMDTRVVKVIAKILTKACVEYDTKSLADQNVRKLMIDVCKTSIQDNDEPLIENITNQDRPIEPESSQRQYVQDSRMTNGSQREVRSRTDEVKQENRGSDNHESKSYRETNHQRLKSTCSLETRDRSGDRSSTVKSKSREREPHRYGNSKYSESRDRDIPKSRPPTGSESRESVTQKSKSTNPSRGKSSKTRLSSHPDSREIDTQRPHSSNNTKPRNKETQRPLETPELESRKRPLETFGREPGYKIRRARERALEKAQEEANGISQQPVPKKDSTYNVKLAIIKVEPKDW